MPICQQSRSKDKIGTTEYYGEERYLCIHEGREGKTK